MTVFNFKVQFTKYDQVFFLTMIQSKFWHFKTIFEFVKITYKIFSNVQLKNTLTFEDYLRILIFILFSSVKLL